MSIYGSDELFGGGFAAVEAIRDKLAGSGNIVATNWLDSSSYVYAHALPEDLPLRLILVRELSFAGGRTSNNAMVDDVPVQVMAMCRSTLANGAPFTNAQRWLSNLHRRVQRTIAGASLSLVVGTVALPARVEEYPSAPALDERIRYWYSTAQYNVTLESV